MARQPLILLGVGWGTIAMMPPYAEDHSGRYSNRLSDLSNLAADRLANARGEDLPPNVAELFVRVASRRTLVAGEELYSVGSAPQAMYGVLSGELRIGVTGENGSRFFAALLGPGRWCGEVPLLDGKQRVFHANATTETEIAVLGERDFWHLIHAHPGVLLAVTRLVCTRYRIALAWIEDANLKSPAARIAGRIVALVSEITPRDKAIRVSQELLANQLGLSRQSVNRQLKIWERQGMLRVSYGQLEILDPFALERAAR